MSGGSYDYACFKFHQEYAGNMFDDELDELVEDFYGILHDVEWWQSGDIGEEKYRKTCAEFKKKWFGARDKALQTRLADGLEKARKAILEV